VVAKGFALPNGAGLSAPRSLSPEGFDLDVECDFHFEFIPLTDGNVEVRAVKRADCIGHTRASAPPADRPHI
jgi:hypothetical protein